MDDVAKLKDKAAKAWSKGNWAAAAEAYEELFRAEPKNLMHKLRVGDALVKQTKTTDAIAVYDQVAERYAADGMLIKAISVNKLILQLDPQQKDTQKRLAALYSKRGVATAASRAAGIGPMGGLGDLAPGGRNMDLPETDANVMVVETGAGQRVVSNTHSTAPNAAATLQGKGAIIPPSPSPSPSPAPAPAPAGAPFVALSPSPAPSPAPPPSPSPVPSAPPIVMGIPDAAAPIHGSQSLAAEIIELGPADVADPGAPETVESAVEQAKQDLKESGSEVDLDALFGDVGDIPQVPPTPLFSDLQPAEFERIIELLAPIRVPEGTDICREGEPANSMFVIAQGSVSVYFTDEVGTRVPLAKLVEGDFFGEFALFEGGVRKASVQANEETELLELSKENFDLVVAEFPAAAGVLRMFYYARLADTFLAKSSIFGSLSRDSRWEFVRRMTLQRYNATQPILREGETGDALYMIRTGSVRILTGTGADAITLADLPAGEIFGEIAVINLQPRTATVVAQSEVELYRLDRESARRLISSSASIAARIKEIAEARVRNTIDAMITGSVGNTGSSAR